MLINYGLPAHPATPPAPEQGQGRWTEGVGIFGPAILFDGAMVPIEEVVRALNGRPATPPAPEVGGLPSEPNVKAVRSGKFLDPATWEIKP
jgi:hypothetical protein